MRRPAAVIFRRFFLCLPLWAAAWPALIADQVSDLKKSLLNTDPAVRAEAIKKFVISLGTVNGEASMIPSVPVLLDALNDPEAKVRLYAISGLRGILFLHSPKFYHSLPRSSNLTSNPSLQPALLKASSDSEPEIRQLALECYAITYNLTPELEEKIIIEFKSLESEQPHQESQRPALMESLILSRSPSPKAEEFITDLLSDPRWAPQVASAMGADACPLSDTVLPKLVTLLEQDRNTVNRAAYARAIGSYGKRAQSYRPQLEAALLNETDSVTKQNIQRSIDRIQ